MHQERDSHYRSFTLAHGRGDLRGTTCTPAQRARTSRRLLYGLYLSRGDQLADNHTAIYHDQPNCRSWEVYKGILDGAVARRCSTARCSCTPEAQKTDAKQTNRNLLLSERAKVDTKPQLEIFADDVKCTHGATVGELDENMLFYLQSRGIPQRRPGAS